MLNGGKGWQSSIQSQVLPYACCNVQLPTQLLPAPDPTPICCGLPPNLNKKYTSSHIKTQAYAELVSSWTATFAKVSKGGRLTLLVLEGAY